MTRLSLYRKYRPATFEDVSGQRVIINILKNAIQSSNISHAYLFTGPRGTGKTSIAKIFARAVNCEQIGENAPCCKCDSCLNSLSKECVDIIEIDAASNNGVDEIRELKSKISIVPSYLKYKIYIIDEVHMLSIGAFNALLKTLEEPPSHVIFILATTEINKIPSTILSRCQVMEFKKISPNDMTERIVKICAEENIDIDNGAIEEIVINSEGCMRDALSFLEKVTTFCNGKVTVENVRLVSGKIPLQEMKQMIDNVICGDIEFVINQINKIYLNDGDLNGVLEDIINELEKNIFKKNLNDKNYQSVLSKMIEIYDKMKKSSVNNKIIFEMGILEYCTNQQKIISREIILPQKECQKETSNTSVDKIESNFEEKNDGMDVDETEFKNIRINNTFANANKEFLNQIKNKWSELSEHAFDKEYGAVICSLMDGTPVAASDNYVIITYPHHIETIKINRDYTNFENVINKFLKSKYNIVAITEEEWNNAKKEYITKLNSKENYLLVNDKFIQEDEQIISREIISHSNVSEIIEKNSNSDNKIFELFDSKYIDIK